MKDKFKTLLNDNYTKSILKTWKHIVSQDGGVDEKEVRTISRSILNSSMSGSGLPTPGLSRQVYQVPTVLKEDDEDNWEDSFNRLSEKH